MMSIKSKTAQAETLEVFAKQATETYTGSVVFMKQLTTVAISTITYLKNVFHEENFKVELLNGIRMRILKKDCKDELAQFVSTALMQAFEAFDKKYLHKLAVCFYEGESCEADNLLEYFVFEYSYTDAGVTMDVTSKSRDSTKRSQYTFEHVRERMVQLIRTCVVMMDTQYQLPETYDISLRLYYNDAAPEGYQAPGYLSASDGDDHLEVTSSNGPVRLGSVHTPFHRLVARSYVRDGMHSSHDAEPSQNAPMMTQMDEFEDTYAASEPASEAESNNAGLASRVRCSCLKEDYEDVMLTCDECGYLQHAACHGRAAPARGPHACARCAPAAGHDPRLAALTDRKRECLCILRRSLSLCARRSSLGVRALRDDLALPRDNAHKLFQLLVSLGVLEDSELGITHPRKIVPDQLKVQMKKHFYLEEMEVVDRLVAESLSQGSSRADPVGDMLGPMEMVSLHNAATLGIIIEPPTQGPVVEDATLQQYKQALLSNENIEEELPLSGNHNPVQNMAMIGKKTAKRAAGKENTRSGVKGPKRAKAK